MLALITGCCVTMTARTVIGAVNGRSQVIEAPGHYRVEVPLCAFVAPN